MNNIKRYRLMAGIQQKDLAKMIGVDAAMMCRFENGACLPPVDKAKALASVLDAPVRDLFDEDDTEFIFFNVASGDGQIIDGAMSIVLSRIRKGKKKRPVSREELMKSTSMTDRAIRKEIERLRAAGFMIVNSGSGYYMTVDVDEIEEQYRKDCKRVRSILRRLYPMRRFLKDAGRTV